MLNGLDIHLKNPHSEVVVSLLELLLYIKSLLAKRIFSQNIKDIGVSNNGTVSLWIIYIFTDYHISLFN